MKLKGDIDWRMETRRKWERGRSKWGEKRLNERQNNQMQKTDSYYWR